MSLRVHPLQLYFLVAALLSFLVLLSLQKRQFRPGRVQLVFYLLFFAGTAVIEPLRQNVLTLNNIVAPLAATVCFMVALSWIPWVRRAGAARMTSPTW
jgi:prolipoprotein diacylglyceryltransferase